MVNFEVENEREQRKMGLMRTLTRNDPESSLESIKEKRKGYDIPEEISISEFVKGNYSHKVKLDLFSRESVK